MPHSELGTGVMEPVGPQIRRLIAPNPSPLTGTGTNTYLLGEGEVTVIDPGPDDSAHLSAILTGIGPQERICRIIVTHSHIDHSALAPRLARETGAPIFAFGNSSAGLNPALASIAGLGGGEGNDRAFAPDQLLGDGEILEGEGWHLEVIHTPGHLGNHICLRLGDLLFSGDHVMGWSTSIVSPPEGDMAAYMASLHRLAALPLRRLLPGHGAPVENGPERIAELIIHRKAREAQVLAALADQEGTAEDLARRIYTEISPHLIPAAARNVLAHLLDLAERSQVLASPAPAIGAIWKISHFK